MRGLGCLVIVLASCLCWAEESKLYLACNSHAKTQYDMNACANDEAKRLDDELNRIYKLVLSKAADDPVATAKIKAAEKAWMVYRDAYIEAMYPAEDKHAEYGSIYPMDAALLGAKITRQQIGALRELLKQY
jgi:uncharacterized protein YecT (DUF1311 family)